MDVYPLDPLDLARVRPVSVGRLHRMPRTVAEVLADASRSMDEQDQAELRAADPVTWLQAERRKRNLWARLFR